MRSSLLRVFIVILGILISIPRVVSAQAEQTAGVNAPIAQPLVREGDFAADLAEALKLGTAMSETEAESKLSSIGISPQNGWIADYPVTPDVIGELQTSINAAADSGKLSLGKDAAMSAFQDVVTRNKMAVKTALPPFPNETPGLNYPEPTGLNDYYTTEGPPVVTYYAPPPDYAYLYTWVPYPFWWSDFWYPGFFVLVDFAVRVHGHGHLHRHGEFISNHYHDPRTGKMVRVDPTNRSRGGTFTETGDMRRASPSVQKGAQAILNKTEAYGPNRGYGVVSKPSAETRSSAFERSANTRFERAASDRGFRSRTNAGHIPAPARGSAGGGGFRGGGGYHGGGRSR
ncbi:MAG TPA: hypothetical protein VEI57_00365 [Nitrospirota bacterium]|nr:hypothetical protein [Nitrospirota bacterium]